MISIGTIKQKGLPGTHEQVTQMTITKGVLSQGKELKQYNCNYTTHISKLPGNIASRKTDGTKNAKKARLRRPGYNNNNHRLTAFVPGQPG